MPAQSDLPERSSRLPGVYEKLLAGACRCGFPCRSEPRLRLQQLSAEQQAMLGWFAAQCAWEAEQDRAERLAVGEPIVVPRWKFGGRSVPRDDSWPAWLRDRDVKTIRVFSDDRVVPIYDA